MGKRFIVSPILAIRSSATAWKLTSPALTAKRGDTKAEESDDGGRNGSILHGANHTASPTCPRSSASCSSRSLNF